MDRLVLCVGQHEYEHKLSSLHKYEYVILHKLHCGVDASFNDSVTSFQDLRKDYHIMFVEPDTTVIQLASNRSTEEIRSGQL